MDLKQKLNDLHNRVDRLKDSITTEEATKNAFVMPFIQILGYDVFNPVEVVPEYTADIGTKKGEKVDYAIMKDGNPIIIIECKHWKENLDRHNSQLHRYFNVTKSRFAILTNGLEYEFYADLEKTNIMDSKPFLYFNINDLKDTNINELSKFHKNTFDLDKILVSANSLKYIKAIRNEFEKEIENPSDKLTKLLVSRFYDGVFTSKRLDSFKDYTKKAIKTSINDVINSRLKSAITKEEEEQEQDEVIENQEVSKINTTQEELDAYQIVKAILRKEIPSDKISYRDTQTYFGILYDDNNRKPICRLYLEGRLKRIQIFDENKNSFKYELESIDDIYNFSTKLLDVAVSYKND